MSLPAQPCIDCGTPFAPTRRCHRSCSLRCRQGRPSALQRRRERRRGVLPPRSCPGCGTPIAPDRRSDAVWCSPSCHKRTERRWARSLTKPPTAPPGADRSVA